MTTALPTLYKKTSTGAIQQWRVWVEGPRYFTEHGQVGGRLQVSEGTLCEGKNVGRSNETTPEQQAELEALSKWEKKAKSGYVTDPAGAEAGDVHADYVAGGVLPMLAQSYSKHAPKIRFPAYVQPKLDGHRCLAVVGADGSCTLWSRTRKVITGVPHVAKAVEAAGLRPGTVLDGELYNHDYRENFEELTSFIRQATPKPGHEAVEYWVYDLPSSEEPYAFRGEHLEAMLLEHTAKPGSPLRLVHTRWAGDEDELMEHFTDFVAAGFEGAMVRNSFGPYVGKRSYDLQKVKEMEDAEFLVTGVEEGRGRMAGRAVFVCRTGAGAEFRVKMQGSLDALRAFVADPSLAVGRMLTVKYQAMTAAGVPRFPVGVRLREDP